MKCVHRLARGSLRDGDRGRDKETLAAREAEINALDHQLFHLTPEEIDLIEYGEGV